jgi:Fur family ferric uptake transcriptional regulator
MDVDVDLILKRLQQSGRRDTGPRRAIVSTIASRRGAFTAQEIADELAPRGVGRATVFRTLAALQELGHVARLHVGAECERYALCDGSHHHHLVCTGCGDVFPIDECAVDDLTARAASQIGFAVEGHHLDVYGRCAACLDAPRTVRSSQASANQNVQLSTIAAPDATLK